MTKFYKVYNDIENHDILIWENGENHRGVQWEGKFTFHDFGEHGDGFEFSAFDDSWNIFAEEPKLFADLAKFKQNGAPVNWKSIETVLYLNGFWDARIELKKE